jgi:ADP-ribose pyrophosphatase YjhB (NUDIX family)
VRDATGLEGVRLQRRLADGFVQVAATGESPEEWEHGGARAHWEQIRADLPLTPPHATFLHGLIRKRVVAYITRERSGRAELLTIEHRDLADLGLQVPAGRIDAHESLETGLHREVEEETGLGDVRIVAELADADEFERLYGAGAHRSWAFHAVAEAAGPDEWEHPITGTGMDASLVYMCRWLPLESRLLLWGKPDPLAEKLRRSITTE